MREILFRGKRKANGVFAEGFLFIKEEDSETLTCIGIDPLRDYPDGELAQGCYFEIMPETVGQFTGLTDKNGKKIFEGDIILFEDESPSNYEYHDCTEMRCGAIEFDDGQFYLTNRIAVEMEDLIYDGVIEGEIIGNIHDNPELLEEGADNA